jgi:hypothetical protein
VKVGELIEEPCYQLLDPHDAERGCAWYVRDEALRFVRQLKTVVDNKALTYARGQ